MNESTIKELRAVAQGIREDVISLQARAASYLVNAANAQAEAYKIREEAAAKILAADEIDAMIAAFLAGGAA